MNRGLLAAVIVLSTGLAGWCQDKTTPMPADLKKQAAVIPPLGPARTTPGATWETRDPGKVGMSQAKLDQLKELVQGRGCVVRHGYMVYAWGDQTKSIDVASATKPVISTLLCFALQEGKLKSVDDKVADFEPRLRTLNEGKDAAITWRHLASQTSGYGLREAPGQAYAYNDYALALYYDLLTGKVFQAEGRAIFQTRLGDELEFQDDYSFTKGWAPGRLSVSVRDFARFGLLYLRGGEWRGKTVLKPELIRMAIASPISADTPLTAGKDAAMLPDQRTLGGDKNGTPIGPGCYSFNWWTNGLDRMGKRLLPDAPPDTYVALGIYGQALWIIPSLDLIVSWSDSDVQDWNAPGNPDTKCNRAARLLRETVVFAPQTRVGIVKDRWHINGQPTYRGSKSEGLLLNVRMVNAIFEDRKRPTFDSEVNADRFIASIPDYAAHGVRAFSLNLQGGFPAYEGAVNSAFNPDGSLRDEYLRRVHRVIEACDRHGVVVILGCYYQRQDQILKDGDAVKAGVINVAKRLKNAGFTNVVLEIANEFPIVGFDHRILQTAEGEVELLRLAKRTAPDLLVSTSGYGDGELADAVARASDFLLVHFNGVPLDQIPAKIAALSKFGKPVVCNEDEKTGPAGAKAAEVCVAKGASWGLMLEQVNQHYPFAFRGAADDPLVYAKLKELTSP